MACTPIWFDRRRRRAGKTDVKLPTRTLAQMLEGRPCPLHIRGARDTLAGALDDAGSSLVVVDDDPTGTQTVHGVPVLLQWSV